MFERPIPPNDRCQCSSEECAEADLAPKLVASRKDTAIGALFVAALVLAGVAYGWVQGWFDAAAAEPPGLILYQDAHLAREPDGNIVAHPALTEVHACADGAGIVASINPFARTFTFLQPCASLFRDGFD